jgi:ribosomal protein S16
MILIRFKRRSSKNNLTYSIVVTSNQVSAKSNQFIEKIGYYNPIIDKWSNKYLFIDFDRLQF